MTWLYVLAWLVAGVPVSRRMTWVFLRATAMRLPAIDQPAGFGFDGPICGNCGGRRDFHPGGRHYSIRDAGNWRACNTFVPNDGRTDWPAMEVTRWHTLSALIALIAIPLWPVALAFLAIVWVGPHWAVPIETRQDSIQRRLAAADAMNAETDRILRDLDGSAS